MADIIDLKMMEIPIDLIDDSAIKNIRKSQKNTMETPEYEALYSNIKKKGIIEPITLCILTEEQKKDTNALYGIVDGNLRFQSVKKLHEEDIENEQWKTIPAKLLKPGISVELASMILNISKVNMSDVEKGRCIFEYKKTLVKDEHSNLIKMTGKNKDKYKKVTQEDIATEFSLTPARISQLLKAYKLQMAKKDIPETVKKDNPDSVYLEIKADKIEYKTDVVSKKITESMGVIADKIASLDAADTESVKDTRKAIQSAKQILDTLENEIAYNPFLIDKKIDEKKETIKKLKKELTDIAADDKKYQKKSNEIKELDKQINRLSKKRINIKQ